MNMLADDIVHLFVPHHGLWQVSLDAHTGKIPYAPDVDLAPPGGGIIKDNDIGELLGCWKPGMRWQDCTLLVAACPCCRETPWTHDEVMDVEAELFDWLIDHGMHSPNVFHDEDDEGKYYVGIEFPCEPMSSAEEVL